MTLKKEQQHRHAATPHNGSYSSSEADSVLAGLVLTLMDSRRNGRMPTRRASILKVTRSFSWASSHSSRTVRPSTNTRMPFWYRLAQLSASRCHSSTGAQKPPRSSKVPSFFGTGLRSEEHV